MKKLSWKFKVNLVEFWIGKVKYYADKRRISHRCEKCWWFQQKLAEEKEIEEEMKQANERCRLREMHAQDEEMVSLPSLATYKYCSFIICFNSLDIDN